MSIGPVLFEIYCYAPDELGPFPCHKNVVSEFCLRNGKCPYASAIPTSLSVVALSDVGLFSLFVGKVVYWIDQIYCFLKWMILPRKFALNDLESVEDEINDPAFLTWAKLPNTEVYQFAQWLNKVHEDADEFKEEALDPDSEESKGQDLSAEQFLV